VLARGSSDHHPISLKLHTLPGVKVLGRTHHGTSRQLKTVRNWFSSVD
jgi:hypothetical protein